MDESWAEVERMAKAVSAPDAVDAFTRPTDKQITRWVNLFNYSRAEASSLILQQRQDVTRERVSDGHWDLVREEREAMGHDRETYEHEQQLGNTLNKLSATITTSDGARIVLVRLGGLLDTPQKIQEIASLSEPPPVEEGESDMSGNTRFCMVSEETKRKIDEYLAQQQAVSKKP